LPVELVGIEPATS